jgi:ATP-dependent helicase/nuclease subunit A
MDRASQMTDESMRLLRRPPTQDQRRAADPGVSAWVSANAGSGKTTVLTDRVIRLLLKGARPAGILCLTFTKAAAANMQNKIFETLGNWVALEDAALRSAIEDMTGAPPSATDLISARRLFARAVETPGGLKVQTIHSFCERLLHQAPFEAGVPAHFEVMEEMDATALLTQAITATMREALNDPQGGLRRALQLVSLEAGEESALKALRSFMTLERKARSAAPTELKFANSGLSGLLDIAPDDTSESIISALRSGSIYRSHWQEIRDWLAGSSKPTEVKNLKLLTDAFRSDGQHIIESYTSVFLTKDRQKKADQSLATKDVKGARPDLFALMDAERDRVFELVDKLSRVQMRDRTEAIRVVAANAFERYRRTKRQQGLMDFGDLIEKTVALLESDAAAWVLYKLDQGIDHILVDEAQDTSPEQWQIVKAIAGDFFSGQGARAEAWRTLFAVGDEKQSIYGFQGARPKEFNDAQAYFQGVIESHNEHAARPHDLRDVKLRTSFRTGPDILAGVDQVFRAPANFAGLDSTNEAPQHNSNRDRDAGLIEVWDGIIGGPQDKPKPDDPVDAAPADSPPKLLAEQIAARIKYWLSSGACFANDGVPIQPGDILILVRSRGPIFESIIRALKQKKLPVAGADRLKVFSNIAVMDLLALGQVCLLPEDDLALACLLKSPLCGLDDAALEEIAAERGSMSLWQSLAEKAPSHPRFAGVHHLLSTWRDMALRLTPLEFYRSILSAGRGRELLVERLGPDAEEAITAFLAMLRGWQAKNPASLALFLAHVAADERDVRRDMDEAHGRIRVMTVHGAKGLEARVVFLADTMHPMESRSEPILLLKPEQPESAVWAPRSKDDPSQAAEMRLADKEDRLAESRRLLYVALTRAKDQLYVVGARGSKNVTHTWHALVLDALKDSVDAKRPFVETKDELTGDTIWRWQDKTLPIARPGALAAAKQAPDLPEWLQAKAPSDLPRPPPLRPSRLIDAAEPPAMEQATLRRKDARLRGEAVHLLLQHLAGRSDPGQLDGARRLLQARFPALDPALRESAILDTMRLMQTPELAPLFCAEGRNEAAIAGEIELAGQRIEVAGRIDRIVILEDAILMMDYKTGRPPAPGAVPDGYVLQLAVYRALLTDLYPGKPIRTAVIWTMAARIDWIPDVNMDAALQHLASQGIKLA